MVNSKHKGAGFELEVSKLLSEKTGNKWFRVGVSSGARATTQGLGSGFMGDVFCEDAKFKDVIIECKACKELNISELFNTGSKFYCWLEQTKVESKGLLWCLFFKPNNMGVYAVGSDDVLVKLGFQGVEPSLVFSGNLKFIKVK